MWNETDNANCWKAKYARVALSDVEETPSESCHEADSPYGSIDQTKAILPTKYAENVGSETVATGDESY